MEPRCVIGEPLRLRRWKGCVWIDLDERVAGLQRTRVGLQAVIAGGSWRIPEVQILLNAPTAHCKWSFTGTLRC